MLIFLSVVFIPLYTCSHPGQADTDLDTPLSTIEKTGFITPINETVAAANQIAVQSGDFLGFKSSGSTIVRYHKTNHGVGINNENVRVSDAAGHKVSTTTMFSDYVWEPNIKFGLQATLGPGVIPQFQAGLATTSSVTDDTAVRTTLLTVVATDPGDTLTLILHSTTPASTAFNFEATSGVLSTVDQLPTGNTVFIFRVTDLCGNTADHTFTLTIANAPPVIQNLPASTEVSEDLNVETQLHLFDVIDTSLADTITCSITNVDPSLSAVYLNATGTLNGYAINLRANAGLNYNTQKTYIVTVECTDTKDTTSGTFFIYVVRRNTPTTPCSGTSTVKNLMNVIPAEAFNERCNFIKNFFICLFYIFAVMIFLN